GQTHRAASRPGPTCKTGAHGSEYPRGVGRRAITRGANSRGTEHQCQKTIRPEPAADPRRPSTTDAGFSQPGEKRLSGHEWKRRFNRHDTAGNRLSYS